MEGVQTKTKIKQLHEFGQSVWLDNISRSIIENGRLKELIDSGVTGVTSNPTIFDKAISGGEDYDVKIKELKPKQMSAFDIYDALTVGDIQDAADLLRSVFQETKGNDGYVSLEVNPLLAHNSEETVKEARRLHKKVARPNVMFKIPATVGGFEAGRDLLSTGISVNFTLIFSLQQYAQAIEAFLKGAREYLDSGGDLENIASVASVFVIRIDSSVDKLIEEKLGSCKNPDDKVELENLRGRAAVANSQLIFAKYSEEFSGSEFSKLEQKGLKKQKVLWASTSTKNPSYSDLKYVAELIAKDTINTMPTSTLDAFLDHGIIKNAWAADSAPGQAAFESLRKFGIDVNKICAKLLSDGVAAFEKSFDSLLETIKSKSKKLES